MDGFRVKTVVGSLESNSCAHFVHAVRKQFGPCKHIELVMDSTRCSTKDTQVCIGYAPEINLAAYLPPIVNRQLKWREGVPGSDITSF